MRTITGGGNLPLAIRTLNCRGGNLPPVQAPSNLCHFDDAYGGRLIASPTEAVRIFAEIRQIKLCTSPVHMCKT